MDTRPTIARDAALEASRPILDARSGEPYEYDDKGYVPFTLAATVICLRRRPGGAKPSVLRLRDLAVDAQGTRGSLEPLLAAAGGELRLEGRWQVLLGQSQVVNYLRTRDHAAPRAMRYPGELKLPGGAKDPEDASLRDTARRELAEELLLEGVPAEELVLRPLRASQTRRVAGRSNMMLNFVAFADENPWLDQLDLAATNSELARREAQVEELLADGKWGAMSDSDKRQLAPEMHSLEWIDLSDAVTTMQASIGRTLAPVSSWQASQFRRLGLARRDPMSVTMQTLLEADRRAPALRASQAEATNYEAMIMAESRRFSLTVDKLGRRRDAAQQPPLHTPRDTSRL